MSRLTIDISPEQHQSLKAMAALEGKTIRQYALERLFPRKNPRAAALPAPERVITLADIIDKPEAEMDEQEREALGNLRAFLEERAIEAEEGKMSRRTPQQILDEVLGDGSRQH